MNKQMTCLLTAVLLAGMTAMSNALADWRRGGSWDVALQPNYLESMDVAFEGGARADINSDVGFGFGVAHNLSARLGLRMDFGWNSTGYTATRVLEDGETETFGSRLDTSTIAFGADYYLTEGRFAPYVGGSFGWTFIDTNIPEGRPITTCWWDPWWGYICDTYQPSVTDTQFTYGLGAGLRVDLDDNMFVRLGVAQYRLDFDNSLDDTDYTVTRLDIGFSY